MKFGFYSLLKIKWEFLYSLCLTFRQSFFCLTFLECSIPNFNLKLCSAFRRPSDVSCWTNRTVQFHSSIPSESRVHWKFGWFRDSLCFRFKSFCLSSKFFLTKLLWRTSTINSKLWTQTMNFILWTPTMNSNYDV